MFCIVGQCCAKKVSSQKNQSVAIQQQTDIKQNAKEKSIDDNDAAIMIQCTNASGTMGQCVNKSISIFWIK
jgi:protein subunit release factor B